MNASADHPWSRRKWSWILLLFIALEAATAWYWIDPRPLAPQPVAYQPTLNLRTMEPADPWWTTYLGIADPSLFARAGRHGFSGAAWLNPPPLPQNRLTWADTQPWLGLNLQQTPEAEHYWIDPQPVWNRVAEKPVSLYAEIAVPNETVQTTSFLRLEGGLRDRPIQSNPALPAWPYAEALRETVLHLLVNAGGTIMSARLESGCESADANQFALTWAQSARFQPLPGSLANGFPNFEPLVWGRAVFYWATTNLPATNQTGLKS